MKERQCEPGFGGFVTAKRLRLTYEVDVDSITDDGMTLESASGWTWDTEELVKIERVL